MPDLDHQPHPIAMTSHVRARQGKTSRSCQSQLHTSKALNSALTLFLLCDTLYSLTTALRPLCLVTVCTPFVSRSPRASRDAPRRNVPAAAFRIPALPSHLLNVARMQQPLYLRSPHLCFPAPRSCIGTAQPRAGILVFRTSRHSRITNHFPGPAGIPPFVWSS